MMKIELLSCTKDPTTVLEDIGRTCYKSKPGENYVPGTLIKSLIRNGHTSVLEHASAGFRITGVSRSLTHQLVRHRLASYTQQSQRYVKETQFDYVIPPKIEEKEEYYNKFKDQMETIQKWYNEWIEIGMKAEDARFVLPNSCCTEICMTANFREWRSIISLRSEKSAQWEIRQLSNTILIELHSICPSCFQDLYNKYILGE